MTVWDAVIGQPRAVATLERAAGQGRQIVEGQDGALSHSWLITGPPGSGRSVAAVAFAAALQCTGEPIGCGQCACCRTTVPGNNLDVAQLSTEAATISVKQVREILALAQSRPTDGRWRVIIVEDADRMREDSANMLLKNLEEPPARTIWILCAPTPADLLVTIRSRCRQLQLGTPPVAAVEEYLQRQEGATPEQAHMAARVSQSHIGVARALIREPELRGQRANMFMSALRVGSVGEAVLAAGKLVKAAQESGAEQHAARAEKEKAVLLATLGVEGRVPPALRAQLRNLEEDQKRREKRALADVLDRVLIDLLGFFRDVVTVQLRTGVDLINPDLADEVHFWAAKSTPQDTLRRVQSIELARLRLQTSVAPLLNMESLLVALHNPEVSAA